MNPVTFPCSCGATLEIGRERIGLQARCANCGSILIVPDPSNPETRVQANPAPQGVVKVVKWMEPSIMKRLDNRTLNRWISLGMIFGMGIGGMILRALYHQGDHPRPYWLVFLGCAAVGFVFDCTRRMLSFIPSFVIVSQHGINLNSLIGIGAHFAFWPWHQIASGKLEVMAIGRKSVRILTLYSHDQQPIGTIGMPPTARVDELAEAFESMGKPLY